MNTFVTSLQFVVLVLCLYGELTRRIKSTFPVTVALGTIFVCTLVSMSKSFSQRGLDDALFWLAAPLPWPGSSASWCRWTPIRAGMIAAGGICNEAVRTLRS